MQAQIWNLAKIEHANWNGNDDVENGRGLANHGDVYEPDRVVVVYEGLQTLTRISIPNPAVDD